MGFFSELQTRNFVHMLFYQTKQKLYAYSICAQWFHKLRHNDLNDWLFKKFTIINITEYYIIFSYYDQFDYLFVLDHRLYKKILWCRGNPTKNVIFFCIG